MPAIFVFLTWIASISLPVADCATAEIDYRSDHIDLLWEDGSTIPLEPFNLRKEREEGYFDAEGNYIEYRLQLNEDAWLAMINELEVNLHEKPWPFTVFH